MHDKSMNTLIKSIINNKKEAGCLEQKYNSDKDTSVELKKALRKSPPRKNPNMSEAEYKLKFNGKESL